MHVTMIPYISYLIFHTSRSLMAGCRRLLSLLQLGLHNGSKVMFESVREDGAWPTARLVEPPGFRRFRLDDKLDVQSKAGVWYPAQAC